MVVDEQSRLALHRRLEDVLGPDAAGTMMAYLPPVTWAHVATKQDLGLLEERVDQRFASLEERMDHRFAMMDQRFVSLEERIDQRFALVDEHIGSVAHETLATLRAEIVNQTRTMVFAMVGSTFTVASLAFAAARLGG